MAFSMFQSIVLIYIRFLETKYYYSSLIDTWNLSTKNNRGKHTKNVLILQNLLVGYAPL